RQRPADVREIRRTDAERLPCQTHRADEWLAWTLHFGSVAAGKQHVAVETGVMRGDEFHARQEFAEFPPGDLERRLAFDYLPRDSMDLREMELPARRAQKLVAPLDDASGLDAHQPNGAGAVAAGVGGLEIDGDEGGRLRHG